MAAREALDLDWVQTIVAVVLGALAQALPGKIPAASQGTMNNLSFGDATFGYYETVGGGSGAIAGHDGASGVPSHMTNTRITDPEVLDERRSADGSVKFLLGLVDGCDCTVGCPACIGPVLPGDEQRGSTPRLSPALKEKSDPASAIDHGRGA